MKQSVDTSETNLVNKINFKQNVTIMDEHSIRESASQLYQEV